MKVKTSELRGAALDWAAGIAAKNEDVELGDEIDVPDELVGGC